MLNYSDRLRFKDPSNMTYDEITGLSLECLMRLCQQINKERDELEKQNKKLKKQNKKLKKEIKDWEASYGYE